MRKINAYLVLPSGERVSFTPDPRFVEMGSLSFPLSEVAPFILPGASGVSFFGPTETIQLDKNSFRMMDSIELTKYEKGVDNVWKEAERSPRCTRVVEVTY